jgi:hypothetical protein
MRHSRAGWNPGWLAFNFGKVLTKTLTKGLKVTKKGTKQTRLTP